MNTAFQPSNRRVLIIDDNLAIHSDFQKILGPNEDDESVLDEDKAILFGEESVEPRVRKIHFELDCASQGMEGLELVKKAAGEGKPYALAFVDIRMPPGWDGVETINRIWDEYPDIQIVICTAYADYSWEDLSRKIGMTDSLLILKKPFDNIEVLQMAHALTKKWNLNQEVQAHMKNLTGQLMHAHVDAIKFPKAA